MNNTVSLIYQSWFENDSSTNSSEDILSWIEDLNNNVSVSIKKAGLQDTDSWYYNSDSGEIVNTNQSFFSVRGIISSDNNKPFNYQPIMIQREIGFLGILCKKIDGVMHFLMQAKIEPGNINKIQISPTLQATKSNFTQRHGGNRPNYLDYFVNNQHEVVVDQVQSEQSSRFYKKRNRNIIIRIKDNEIKEPDHAYKWMTLGQIRLFMNMDNLINMDTRTVVSCIPFSNVGSLSNNELDVFYNNFKDENLFKSIFYGDCENYLPEIYGYINRYKMFSGVRHEFTDIFALNGWKMKGNDFVCNSKYPFKMIFCKISIEGREVVQWSQPLFEAMGVSVFGLICFNDNGVKKSVVRALPECGCFDQIELSTSVFQEANSVDNNDFISKLFWGKVNNNEGILYDHLLSEEGGRFYHEQNRNIILEINKDELRFLPDGYFCVDLKTLNNLVQINNVLNIQLRNMLPLLIV